MASSAKASNPFYVLLVLVGILFFITACAFGVMTVKQLHGAPPDQEGAAGRSMLAFLDKYGFAVLMAEIAVLALATVAAIGMDELRARSASRVPSNPSSAGGGDTAKP